MRFFSKKKPFLKVLAIFISFLYMPFANSQVLLDEINDTPTDIAFSQFLAPVKIYMKNGAGYNGQIVCVDILTDGFEDMLSASFTLVWNNTILKFDHIEGYNLPNLDMNDFKISSGFGSIAMVWTDESNTGIDLVNGSKLFTVCFEILGDVGDFSILAFTSTPTFIFFTDTNSNGAGIQVNSNSGQITVIPKPEPLVVNFTEILDDNCIHKGSIKLDISGGTMPVSFKWNHGPTSKDVFDLSAGEYAVTITDSSMPPNEIVRTKTIIEIMDMPTAIVADDILLNCIYAVELDGSQSTTGNDIVYNWTTDNGELGQFKNNPKADGLSEGNYILEVRNLKSGCFDTASIVVFLNPDLEFPNAGLDTMLCSSQYQLSANLPNGIVGKWEANADQFISDLSNPESSIGDFDEGDNYFIWSFSSANCPDLGADTVVVSYLGMPEAINDTLNYTYEDNEIRFNVATNDTFDSTAVWYYVFDSFETEGVFTHIDDSSIAEFTKPTEFSGSFSFDYEVCSDFCVDYCTKATVFLNFAERVIPEFPKLDSIDVFNAFTPNGDGINDELIFDIINDYPQDAKNSELLVYNRWGDVVYTAQPYLNDWNGTNNSGKDLISGTYYYVLTINLNKNQIIHGDITILRK